MHLSQNLNLKKGGRQKKHSVNSFHVYQIDLLQQFNRHGLRSNIRDEEQVVEMKYVRQLRNYNKHCIILSVLKFMQTAAFK